MMEWTFILNPDTDNFVLTEEPVGWADVALEIIRDNKFHGISVAYSTTDLRFDGPAADFIIAKYKQDRTNADVKIKIKLDCGGDDYEETFQLDFGTYNRICGDACSVSIAFEEMSCFQKFNANFNKKIDIEAPFTFDGVTGVKPLGSLKKTIVLPAKAILKSAEGKVAAGNDVTEFDFTSGINARWSVRPVFADTKYESLQTTQLQNPFEFFNWGTAEDDIVSPVLLYEEGTVKCFDGTFDMFLRMKGKVEVSDIGGGSKIQVLTAAIVKINNGGYNGSQPQTMLAQVVLNQYQVVGSVYKSYDFDISYTNPAGTLQDGDAIYMVIVGLQSAAVSTHPKIRATFYPETEVRIIGKSLCPPTDGEMFLPFETLYRVADAITDGCLTVDSSYYGRTDSYIPYTDDGCGGLRGLTTGLHIRNAPTKKYFTTAQDLIEGLQSIDCVGFSLSKVAGLEKLTIEGLEHFYTEEELLRLEAVKKVSIKSLPGEVPGSVIVGYDKWQTEAVNGLDEFNSTREYRTDNRNAATKIDITSKFIAAGTLLELCRVQNYAQTGAADTKYDNDTFIIQLKRAAGELVVEQGVDLNPANMIDPPTQYNYRLTPVRNLMRWWKWLSGLAFADVSSDKFTFGSGTSNYLAEGQMLGLCSPEWTTVKENQDVRQGDMPDTLTRSPIVRAESITFDYPLSLSEFNSLRANPYGYISFECGEWMKGYINKITFKPKTSIATFDLRTKYE